jgi:hypothetical protein
MSAFKNKAHTKMSVTSTAEILADWSLKTYPQDYPNETSETLAVKMQAKVRENINATSLSPPQKTWAHRQSQEELSFFQTAMKNSYCESFIQTEWKKIV